MTTSLLLAILASVALALTLLAILLAVKTRCSHARIDRDGFQELEIVVKGKYRPDFVVVRRGIPTRLHFIRQEDAPCSDRVIFSEFHGGSRLPAYQTTTINFIPTKCGEFLFTCEFGMYQGRLVVVEPSRRDVAKIRGAASPKQGEKLPHLAAKTWTTLGFTSHIPDKGDQDPGNA